MAVAIVRLLLTVRLKVPILACGVEHESVAVILREEVPGAVGVPDSKPPEDSASPAGSAPEVHEIAPKPPIEVNWFE